MHIGMLTAAYAPVVNGVTRMVALYEKYLAEAGHEVTVFTLGQPDPGIDAGTVIHSPGLPLGQSGYHIAARYNDVAQRKLQEVDILHCHHLVMGLEFAKRYGRSPIVFTNHTRYDLYLSSYGHVPYWLAGRMMRVAWRRLTRNADVIIAPSASIRELLRSFGVREPIVVIDNGVELERFRNVSSRLKRHDLCIPEKAFVLTYVGRISAEKNIRGLLDEFALAAIGRDDLYLMIVGGGMMLETAKRLAGERGLIGQTRFVGPVEPEQVPAYLAMSDGFVSASVSEVHPLAVIEALAATLPVIAFDAPGMHDVVEDGVSGLLVGRSRASLAQAMLTLANDEQLRVRLAEGARTASTQYSIQNNVDQLLSLYRRVIGQHSGQPVSDHERHRTSRRIYQFDSRSGPE